MKCHSFYNEYNGIHSQVSKNRCALELCWDSGESSASAPRTALRTQLTAAMRTRSTHTCADVSACLVTDWLWMQLDYERFYWLSDMTGSVWKPPSHDLRRPGRQESSVILISTTHLIWLGKKSKTRTRRPLFCFRHASMSIPGFTIAQCFLNRQSVYSDAQSRNLLDWRWRWRSRTCARCRSSSACSLICWWAPRSSTPWSPRLRARGSACWSRSAAIWRESIASPSSTTERSSEWCCWRSHIVLVDSGNSPGLSTLL